LRYCQIFTLQKHDIFLGAQNCQVLDAFEIPVTSQILSHQTHIRNSFKSGTTRSPNVRWESKSKQALWATGDPSW